MKLKAWFLATRPWSFVMTVISSALGASFALNEFNAFIYSISLIGLIIAHAATNMINDYFDVKTKVDKEGAPTSKYRPHPYLFGEISRSSFLSAIFMLYALVIAIAFYLYLIRNAIVILLLFIGLLVSVLYTLPQLSLKYKALGEPFVALIWGPFMVLGTYYVLTLKASFIVLIASIPIGILVALVLMANNLRDIEYDMQAGIKTIPIILGRRKALNLFKILLVTCYVIAGVVAYLGEFFAILSFISIYQAYKIIKKFEKEIPVNADPIVANLTLYFGILYIIGILIGNYYKIY
ncbi:MAG: prenyltransferase [Thermoproteota archaeon]|nr:prenyltransferase [Thermoproteota archaeon]